MDINHNIYLNDHYNLIKGRNKHPNGYDITVFPDGQRDVKFRVDLPLMVTIIGNLWSWSDIELLRLFVNAVHQKSPDTIIEVRLGYVIGSRSDRTFNDCNYLVDVVLPCLQQLPVDYWRVVDPHSTVLSDNLIDFDGEKAQILYPQYSDIVHLADTSHRVVVISPDKGAVTRSKVAQEQITGLGNETALVVAEKVRDEVTGRITHYQVELPELLPTDTLLVIDDICDGGRTFIELAKSFNGIINPKYLFVTYGLFSNGTEELFKYYDRIFTTDNTGKVIEVKNASK